jgi:hypothetical protein
MDLEERRRQINERYARRFELRRKVEQRSGRKLVRDAQQGVKPMMKRKEITPRGSAGECVVPERSIDEDRPTKRCGIEDRVSSGDTDSSSGPKGLGDEF